MMIAHDGRGHGHSAQTWDGNHIDRYADDPAEFIDHLNLHNLILVGHSTGASEVAHYIGGNGTNRASKAVLVGAVPPLMLQTDTNPGGLRLSVFDGTRQGTRDSRSQFFRDLSMPFYGYNREGARISDGARDSFWAQEMMGGSAGQYDCIREFLEVDYTDDLKKIDVPALIAHGDDHRSYRAARRHRWRKKLSRMRR